MELKSEEGSLLGYNNNNNNTSIFPPQTLDPHLVQQNPKRPSSDQFNGGGDGKIQPKSTGSSGGGGARFRECRKNHAASAGGKVLDGCGEFMPAGDDGLDALRCAACNCHRNFHRKELDVSVSGGDFTRRTMLHPLQLPPPLKNHWTPVVQPVKMAYGGGGGGGNGGTDSSSEDLNFSGYQSNATGVSAGGGAPPPPPFVMSKKRFRTKFTAEQKGKMMEYAEKVGWRIPREDDVEVQRFCGEIGVKRQVFKVWMHNNKNSNKKLGQNQEDDS